MSERSICREVVGERVGSSSHGAAASAPLSIPHTHVPPLNHFAWIVAQTAGEQDGRDGLTQM
jgi:hypothetical protein